MYTVPCLSKLLLIGSHLRTQRLWRLKSSVRPSVELESHADHHVSKYGESRLKTDHLKTPRTETTSDQPRLGYCDRKAGVVNIDWRGSLEHQIGH